MATGAPGTNGVWQYGEDDSEATFSALLNKAAYTTDTQIGADRTRLTALEARKLSGLVPIIPTGVTASSGSASYNSTTGLVTFTAATGINLAGIFTSAYKNYRLILNHANSGGSDIGGWFTNAGTSITTGWYGAGFYTQYTGATGSANIRSNGNGGWVSYASSLDQASVAILDAVVDSSNKPIYQMNTYIRANGARYIGGYNTDGVSDGFRVSPLTGAVTMTGTMKVYGYN